MEISKSLIDDLSVISDHITSLSEVGDLSFFVTGATGFIGSLIVKSLLVHSSLTKTKPKVVVQVRSVSKFNEVFSEFDVSNIDVIVGDILTPITYVGKIDYILHTASPTNSSFFTGKPLETYNIIVDGFKNILNFASTKSTKMIINFSSMEVYGKTELQSKLSEEDLGEIILESPRSSYPLAKRVTEFYAHNTYLTKGISVCNARLCQTFGAGVLKNEDRVFKMFVDSIIHEKNIILSTDGKSISTYCYTSDAIRAIFTILFKGEPGQTYNVANTETACSIYEMAEIALSLKDDNKKIKIVTKNKTNGLYPPNSTLIVSDEKIRTLGWKPEHNLKSMYERLLDDVLYTRNKGK